MKKKKILSNIIYLLKYVWHIDKRYIMIRIPKIILEAIQPFIIIIFPKLIIDQLLLDSTDIHKLGMYIIFMILLLLILKLTLNVINTIHTNLYNSYTAKHTANLGKKIMSLDYKEIENTKTLNLFEKIKDFDYCENLFDSLNTIITSVLILSGLIIIISKLNIMVFIIITFVVFINVNCNKSTHKYNYEWHNEAAPYKRKNEYSIRLMHGFQYGKEVRIYNLSNFILNKYEKCTNEYLQALYKITLKFLRINIISTLASVLQEGLLYAYLAYKVVKSMITIGDFTMYLSAIQNFSNCLISITNSIVSIGQYSAYMEDFKQFYTMESQVSQKSNLICDLTKEFVISFHNVSFMYPGTKCYVLNNVDLSIKSNEKISIVGTNGAGKTTLVKLLLRLYEPSKGSITLNGIDIREYEYQSYMKLFSAVFQDFRIFAYSIKENIVMGMEKNIDEKLLNEALMKSGFDDKIKTLPLGIETPIYKFLDDDGIDLSGGEAQKLAIARAFYKNTSFVILDEPTSALDPLSEYDIYVNLNNLIKNKSAIFISHRLSSTKFCDKIYVFDQGYLIEEGSHEQLLRNGKLYKEMFEKQSEFYD